jgi:hypothetical protein
MFEITVCVYTYLWLRKVDEGLGGSVHFFDENQHLVLGDQFVLVAVGEMKRLREPVA